MANYSIQRSDLATGNITVTEASTNTATNATLIGQNFTGYGDEIATNFLQMLENFATDVDPTTNPRVVGSAIRGQLWYDTTGTGTLKIYNGAAFDELAKVSDGTTESSTLRWNNTAGRYQAEERIRVSDAGSLTIDNAAAGTSAVAISHDGTSLIFTGTGTTDVTFAGLTGDLTVTGGRGLSVENGATALAVRAGGSSDINFTTASANDINFPAAVTIKTGASSAARAGFNIPTGTAPSSPAQGDMWVVAADAFIRINGVNESLLTAGAAVSVLDDLTDVTAAGTTNAMLYKSAGDWIEAPGLTYNGTNLVATQYNGIVAANLIDRAAPGTISGTATFSNANPIIATAGDIDAINGFGFVTTDAAVAAAIRADSGTTDIQFTHSGTPDWNITGLGVILAANPIHATSVASAASFRSIGDAATWSTADSYISFYDSDESEHGLQIGTLASDGTASRIAARLGNLNLYASNTLTASISATTTTWTSNTITSLVLRAPLSISGATTTATVGDVTSGQQYNVGYNESPTANHVLEDINTGSRIIDKKYIGKFISRTTSTSRSVTLDVDATIPVGASVLVHNGSSSGTLTIVNGTITNLDWIDGSGSLPSRTINRTLSYNSICTLRKVNETTWQIWGNGIT